jgi:hypothetical protein
MHRVKCPIIAVVMLFVVTLPHLGSDATLYSPGGFGRI